MTWNRQTYSLLDWLGDLGGLFDALRYIGLILVEPVVRFKMHETMMSNLYRLKGGDEQSLPDSKQET